MNNFDLRKYLVENKLTTNSRSLNEDVVDDIRRGVEGKEADNIFKAAESYFDAGDADTMLDALDMAADEYFEYYDSKGNEDGVEVAKYILNSVIAGTPKNKKKSNVQDFSKISKNPDKSKWAVSKGTLGINENEVTYKEKKTISSVTFLPKEEGGASETFTLGKEIDGEDYWGTVTQIMPISKGRRRGDLEGVVVAIKTRDGDDGMKFHFNAYGEYVEV